MVLKGRKKKRKKGRKVKERKFGWKVDLAPSKPGPFVFSQMHASAIWPSCNVAI